ncbi:MarR family winged helix-turn-helix transcriptional regulator [Desulfatibacillum aliphaticivorans]|uniref:Transcriptional regulator, MarR family n=1 Tax=Desulfatibacillum aliphaticivorans TaxID=218208 RepID=B8FEL5_DESAL|nr:MarR family transcriptional regulator [Desulfatibacillum aliphaticivorans]ACL03419.1 transcriptional regulator, MarR family [Desulfatibacillum aliphaticivorans]
MNRPLNEPVVFDNKIKEIVWLIRRLIQAEEMYTKELSRTYLVSGPQLACLMALYEKGSLSLSRLAAEIMVKSSTVTGIIDRLENKGLVIRSRTNKDRRVITVELTDKGRDMASDAPPPLQKQIIEGLENLPPQEVAEIVSSLSKLIHFIDEPPMSENGLAVSDELMDARPPEER